MPPGMPNLSFASSLNSKSGDIYNTSPFGAVNISYGSPTNKGLLLVAILIGAYFMWGNK